MHFKQEFSFDLGLVDASPQELNAGSPQVRIKAKEKIMITKWVDIRTGDSDAFIQCLTGALGDQASEIVEAVKEDPSLAEKVVEHLRILVAERNIICVDRSVLVTFPDWVKDVLHPELQNTGPAKYGIAKLEQWLHDGQKDGKSVKGQVIYDHLKSSGLLEGCVGLADLLAIQQKGVAFFRRHFTGKAVFGWKSAVRDAGGSLSVPSLYGHGGEVVLDWGWLGSDWDGDGPALRFAK